MGGEKTEQMKKIIMCLLATLGLSSACGQQNFKNTDVKGFAELTGKADVAVLDVRTAEEFAAGHIAGAVNIDQGQADFMERAKAAIPTSKTVAVYCRSGKRSASAATRLAAEGYRCVNLVGGIMAWQAAQMPTTTDLYEVDEFQTKGGKAVRFHALMHASIRIEYDGREIEVDPVAQLRDRKVDYTAMPKADLLLVTHEHADHYDAPTLRLLSTPGTQLVINKRCADMYGAGQSMANGDRLQLADDITLEAVPAYNITEGHLQYHPKGRDNGYILTLDGLRIYIAGDTEDIPEMQTIKDIDIAFLPCNQPYTMTPDQLVRAAKAVRPKVLFPYHYGQTDLSPIAPQLQAEGIDVRIRHYE